MPALSCPSRRSQSAIADLDRESPRGLGDREAQPFDRIIGVQDANRLVLGLLDFHTGGQEQAVQITESLTGLGLGPARNEQVVNVSDQGKPGIVAAPGRSRK